MPDITEELRALGQELSQTRTLQVLQEASEHARQIRASEFNEGKKRQELQGLADSLTANLYGLGNPVGAVQALAQQFGPQRFASADGAMLEGALSGNKDLVKRAVMADEAAMSSQMKVLKEKQVFEAEQNQLNRDADLQIAGIRSAGKAGGKDLTSDQITKLQEFDSQILTGSSLLNMVKQNPNLVGPLAGRIPGRAQMSPDFAAFESASGQFFDKYRVAVTGAGASPGELSMLLRNVPGKTDRPETYARKMETMLRVGERVKQRYLENLQRANRNVTGFSDQMTGSGSSPAAGGNPYFTPYGK